MILKIRYNIDRLLYKRGVHLSQIRRLLMMQIFVAIILSLAFLVFCRDLWAIHFFLAALLATVNLYFLAQVIQKMVFLHKDAVLSLLLNFYARLFVLGIVLYAMLIWAHFSLVAVLAGFSTVLISIMLWGVFFYIEQKEKEAQVDGS